MNFRDRIFSGVYHPKDVRDEKVFSALAHWEHGEIETLNPLGIRRIHGNSVDFPLIDPRINLIAKVHPKYVKCWVVQIKYEM